MNFYYIWTSYLAENPFLKKNQGFLVYANVCSDANIPEVQSMHAVDKIKLELLVMFILPSTLIHVILFLKTPYRLAISPVFNPCWKNFCTKTFFYKKYI